LTPFGLRMPSQTERYLALARLGRNEWWRYALGAAVILFSWIVLGWVLYAWIAEQAGGEILLHFVAINMSVVAMLAGLVVVVKLIHRRPLMTLVTADQRIDWRRIAYAALVWAVIGLLIALVEHALYPDRYYLTFRADRFFAFAAVALILTPLQAATEELVFRGYVMQGLGLVFRRPAVIVTLSALVFALPHLLNPEVQQHGALLMGATYFTIGLVLAAVALRDGRLELAIGFHASNNLLLVLVANYEGSVLTSESIFTARELDPMYTLVTLSAGALLFYAWFFGRGHHAGPSA
jgi:membrane protease YdiL (CAAX protease family)